MVRFQFRLQIWKCEGNWHMPALISYVRHRIYAQCVLQCHRSLVKQVTGGTCSHDIPCQMWTRYMLFHYTPAKPIDFHLSFYYHFVYVLSRIVTCSTTYLAKRGPGICYFIISRQNQLIFSCHSIITLCMSCLE